MFRVFECFILIAISNTISQFPHVQGYIYNNVTDKYLMSLQNYELNNSERLFPRNSRYRDGHSKREPRFISFETKDNNIEVILNHFHYRKFI